MQPDHTVPEIPPTRPHPGWIVTAAISSMKTFVWALIPLLFSLRDRGAMAMAMATALFGIAIVAWRAAEWRRVHYSAMDETITVESGLLNVSRKSVRPERIHAVDAVETPVSRLLGIAELQITSAGAGENLTIPAIGTNEAEQLQRWIAAHRLERRAAGENTRTGQPSADTVPVVLRRLSAREVFLAGLTSGQIAPATAFTAFGIRIISDILPGSMVDRIPWDPDTFGAGSILALIALAAIFAWAVSILGSVLTNWDFTLSRTEDSLIISSGLLDRKHNSVAIRRIQGVSIVESLLRQPFGYASISLESAAAQRADLEGGSVRHLFPFLRVEDARELIRQALPGFDWIDEHAAFNSLPSRSRRRYLLPPARNISIIAIVAMLLLSASGQGAWWYGLSALALAPILVFHAERQFRDAGWWTGGNDRLVIRHRSIGRTTTYTLGNRVQIRELTQNWLQRRASLGTIWLQTSARGANATLRVVHVDYDAGLGLLRELRPPVRETQAAVAREPSPHGELRAVR